LKFENSEFQISYLGRKRNEGSLRPEVGFGAAVIFENGLGFRRAEDAGDFGERVGSNAIGGDDADGALVDESDAGFGIHDVGVALALVFEELKGVAGSGDGAVLGEDFPGEGEGVLSPSSPAHSSHLNHRILD